MVPLLTMNAWQVGTSLFTVKLLSISLTMRISVTFLPMVMADTQRQHVPVTLIQMVVADTLLHQIVVKCALQWMPEFTLRRLATGCQHCH